MTLNLPRYRCHKEVNAAKIVYIAEPSSAPGYIDIRMDLAVPFGADALFEGEMITKGHWVTRDWFAKHRPEVGGYLVEYEDGYISYSPKKAFEEGYARI